MCVTFAVDVVVAVLIIVVAVVSTLLRVPWKGLPLAPRSRSTVSSDVSSDVEAEVCVPVAMHLVDLGVDVDLVAVTVVDLTSGLVAVVAVVALVDLVMLVLVLVVVVDLMSLSLCGRQLTGEREGEGKFKDDVGLVVVAVAGGG